MGKKAQGDCFRWAYRYLLLHPNATLYQGRVVAPYSNASLTPYEHAWVVDGGLVKDWQTMVAGFGGEYKGRGWPKRRWVALWQPQDVKKYTLEQALSKMIKYDHYGPWP